MKQATALRLLADVMRWDDEKARAEFDFWHLMAALKYDDYRDFLAGMRFLESLVAWLQQFHQDDRECAYTFIRNRLVFISAAERERLVALLYPREIYPRLLKAAGKDTGTDPWFVLAKEDARKALDRQRRSTLFLGLSDGARLDSFRHVNESVISNEQVVVGVQLNTDKWGDLLGELRKDLGDTTALFNRVVLVDDFTASGTSFVRRSTAKWKGKLRRFYDSVQNFGEEKLLSPGYELIIHHHIGTPKARQHLEEHVKAFLAENFPKDANNRPYAVTFGHCYDEAIVITDEAEPAFIEVAAKYFDRALITPHTAEGGSDRLWLGYAECRLPIVLDHNTPNNSFPILWAQTQGQEGASMRPLFRRRQRHS